MNIDCSLYANVKRKKGTKIVIYHFHCILVAETALKQQTLFTATNCVRITHNNEC